MPLEEALAFLAESKAAHDKEIRDRENARRNRIRQRWISAIVLLTLIAAFATAFAISADSDQRRIAGLLDEAQQQTANAKRALQRERIANKSAENQATFARYERGVAAAQAATARAQEQKAREASREAKTQARMALDASVYAKKQADKARRETDIADEEARKAIIAKLDAQRQEQRAKLQAMELEREAIAMEGAAYERSGEDLAQKNQLAVFDNLVEAMKAGRWLRGHIQAGSRFENYPAISPLLALQTILDSGTRLRNRVLLQQPPERILSVSYSPDGGRLVAGTDAGTILVCAPSGREVRRWSAGSAQVLGVGFSDRFHFATTDSDGKLKLWDVQGALLRQWQAHTSAATSVSYSPDAQQLATGGQDGTVKVWTPSGNEVREWPTSAEPGRLAPYDYVPLGVRVRFNPKDGNQLVTSANDGNVQFWNTTGERTGGFSNANASGVSFSPDGQRLAIGGVIVDFAGRTLSVYDPNLPDDRSYAVDVSFRPDGKRLATTNLKSLSLWDLERTSGREEVAKSWVAYPDLPVGPGASYWNVRFGPDDAHIITTREGITRVWDLSGNKISEFDNVASTDLDPTGRHLAVGFKDGFVGLWDGLGLHEITPKWAAHSAQSVASVSLHPDGRRILTAGADDKRIRLWDVADKKTPALLTEWDRSASSAVFSPDGARVLSNDIHGLTALCALNGTSLEGCETWRTESEVLRSWSFRPDGRLLATSGDDAVGPVRVFDVAGKEKELLSIATDNHSPKRNRVQQVTFSPDGQLLATAGIDDTAQVWTLSGLKMAQFAPYGVASGPWIAGVSFSPDGKRLATADSAGRVRLWSIEGLDDLLDRGCEWLGDYVASHPVDGAQMCPQKHVSRSSARSPELPAAKISRRS